jgi:hypothetical protein
MDAERIVHQSVTQSAIAEDMTCRHRLRVNRISAAMKSFIN